MIFLPEQLLARNTRLSVSFGGTDISDDIAPYLLSLVYTDDSDDMADDLKITLLDRGKLWLQHWLQSATQAAAGEKLTVSASILPQNWQQNPPLQTGNFELDSISVSGPPAVITIACASLAFSGSLRQTKKYKVWKNCSLRDILQQITAGAGWDCMFLSSHNPTYDRIEQNRQSDINFLRKLCQDAGISIKPTDGKIVLYEQQQFESQPPVRVIPYGPDGLYTKFKLDSGSANARYRSCRVRYSDPATGNLIEGSAEDPNVSGDQCLELSAKVSSPGEAEQYARKQLRLHNKFARTATFSFPGDTRLLAGNTVLLQGWGGWDGKHIITQAVHSVSNSGYTTQIKIRKGLPY